MYKDYLCRFDSKEHCLSFLEQKGVVSTDEEGMVVNQPYNVDWIGTITRETGQTELVDGEEQPVYETLEGYHINLRTKETFDCDSECLVHPENYYRTWAGGMNVQ